jgi:uncharacterized phage-associated protein
MYGYKERKAAQVAAFFALQAGGGINVLKLAKLLYLTERESMKRFDEPMFFDRLVSMEHGPVTSISLNYVNGLLESPHWAEFISGRTDNDIRLVKGLTLDRFDQLSRADMAILNGLWEQFGNYDGFELRDWTHNNCPEWVNPRGSSKPIPHDLIFKFLDKQNAEQLAEDVVGHRIVSNALQA